MVKLVHEIWEHYDESGRPLPGCCLAGPDGDGYRQELGPGARFVRSFEAGSHYEAMTIYYRFFGWVEYTTNHAWDMEPYPAEWLERQRQMRC